MKIIKRIKYKLTEETLEKDIDSFISIARKGAFDYDYKFGMEGLKIIKQYLRILKEKFKQSEFEECKVCYHKLIIFILKSATHEDEANFGYEDLIGRMRIDWEEIIKNYILCLTKTSEVDEMAEKISEYAISLREYGFNSDTKTLLEELDSQTLENLEKRMLIRAEGVTKKDQDKQEILYFLMNLAQEQVNKEKYLEICERLRNVLPEKEIEFLVHEFEENTEPVKENEIGLKDG